MEDVVTEIADVATSGCEIPRALLLETEPDAGLVPTSDPLTEVAGLWMPPALAEFREYIDDVDIRFVSMSVEPRGLKLASGSTGCLCWSAIIPACSLGVS
jgi:hypothetical protein